MPPDSSKLVDLIFLPGNSTDAANRMLGFPHRPGIWDAFIFSTIRPMLDWGIRRFLIHSPGGALPGKAFEFDQFVRAKEAGMDWILADFVEAWSRFITREKGVEVICYLGTLGDFNAKEFDVTKPSAWIRRAELSVRPALDAGMSIGLDASCGQPLNSPMHRLAQLISSFGTRVYTEGFPMKEQPHWAEFNVISEVGNLHMAKSVGWGVPYESVKGEIVQLTSNPPEGHNWSQPGWELDYYSGLLREGFSLCAPFERLKQQGIFLKSLLAAV